MVIGKFSPLHRGHEALIRCAQKACDEVIIISYSKPEFAGCEAGTRAVWLAELFPTTRRLVVTEDGTRRDAAFRQRQHAWYLEQLNHRGARYLLAEGSIQARVERIVVYLEIPQSLRVSQGIDSQ